MPSESSATGSDDRLGNIAKAFDEIKRRLIALEANALNALKADAVLLNAAGPDAVGAFGLLTATFRGSPGIEAIEPSLSLSAAAFPLPSTNQPPGHIRTEWEEQQEARYEEALTEAAEAFRIASMTLLQVANQAVADLREQRVLTHALLGRLEARLGELDGG